MGRLYISVPLGVLAIAVLLYLIAPVVIANKVEQSFVQGVEQYIAQGGGVDLDYNRGYFRSTARVRTEIRDPELSPDPVVLFFDFDINQEPKLDGSVATIESRIVAGDPALSRLLHGLFPDGVPLSASTTVYFDGAHTTEVRSAAFEAPFPGEDRVTVKWEGMQGRAQSNGDGAAIDYSLEAPLFLVDMPIGRIEMKALSSSGSVTPDPALGAIGDVQYTIESLSFSGMNQPLRLSDLMLEYGVEVGDRIAKSDMRMSISAVDGAPMPVRNFELELVYDNIDKEGLEKFMAASRAIQNAPDDATRQAMMGNLFAEPIPMFLRSSPEIRLERLVVGLPDVGVEADARVYFLGDDFDGNLNPPPIDRLRAEGRVVADRAALVQMLDLFNQPRIAAAVLDAESGNLDPTELGAMTRQATEAQINQVVATGYVEDDGVSLKTNFGFDGRMLAVNGVPFDLVSMMPTPAAPAIE